MPQASLASHAAAIEDIYALSPMQEGILFESVQAAGEPVYFEQSSYAVTGPLDLRAFARAWQAVVARHAVFRTAFVWDSGDRPVQVVYRHVRVPLRVVDLRGCATDRHAAVIAEFEAADRRLHFDLGRAPLVRVTLFQLADTRSTLVWSHHHISCDGWSCMLALKEVLASYQAYGRGQEPQWSPVAPYRDYIAWLHAQDRAEAEGFWRRTLEGVREPSPLPWQGDEREGTGDGDVVVRLDQDVTRALTAWAQRERLTLTSVVLGCWGLLLALRAGRQDAVFGTTASTRPAAIAGVDRMVGLFINTVPVRVSWRMGDTVGEWLTRLQVQQAEARERAYVSLAEVQGWSDSARGRRLFDSIVVVENYPTDAFERGYGPDAVAGPDRGETGVRIEKRRGFNDARIPLLLSVSLTPRLGLHITYDRAKFSAATAGRILEQLQDLLRTLASGTTECVMDLLLRAEPKRVDAVAVAGDGDEQAHTQTTPVPSRIATWASRAPTRVAMRSGTTSIGYETLQARASAVGRELQQLGVARETRVGIFLPRSIDFVVACLGVWNAGGAYVPLDPSWPTARVSQVMDDAGVSVVITERARADHVPTSWAQVLTIETCEPAVAESADPGAATDAAWPTVLPTQAAYVLYTSGSTGQPKGVVVPHGGLSQYVAWAIDAYDVASLPWAPWHTSASFDLSVTSLWVPLAAGQSVEVLTGETGFDALTAVGKSLQAGASGLVKLTPAHLRALRTTWGATDLPPGLCRTIVVGGEALSYGDTAGWAGIPGVRLINEYGPTETTVGCCVAEVEGNRAPAADAPVPIGRPIAGATLYVVDARGAPLPAGAAGELWIGGAGVARGYQGRPALTAASFVPDPWGPPGARVYRSGDRVRQRIDGQLEYLGRRDGQVKIRGYRVELGEIEQLLRTHAPIAESAVVVRPMPDGSGQLIAYISPRHAPASASSPTDVVAGVDVPDAATLDGATVRRWLAERLPEYMVPAAVVVLERLPVTANGKLDRQALPAVVGETTTSVERTSTPMEEMVGNIWMQVLRRSGIAADADFFEEGGHSLLAAQVVSRVREVFGVDLPLAAIFEYRRLPALAQAIARERQRALSPPEPPITVVDRGVPLPLSFAQQRMWLLQQLDPGAATYHIPLAVRFDGALDIGALRRSLHAMLMRHEVLRIRIVMCDGEPRQEPIQGSVPDAILLVPLVDLSALPQDTREVASRRLALSEVQRPFDLECGPMLRACVLRVDARAHVFVLTLHHIASDGWSMGLLMREFAAHYEAAIAGRDATMAPLPVQYADYAAWQRRWLDGDVLDRQLAYWTRQLADPPDTRLPRDRARGTGGRRGARLRVVWPESLSRELRDFSRETGATLFMTLLAGLNAVLSRYTLQHDIVVGTDVANRHRLATEPLVGCFVNQLVLRTRLDGDPTFRELVARVRGVALDAYAHQDLPFERLVEALAPVRDRDRAPLFQIKMVLHERGAEMPALADLRVTGLSSAPLPAAFDLSLFFTNAPDAILGSIEYAADRFDEDTIARVVRRLQTFLQDAMDDPDRRLSQLDTMPAPERRLLDGWNATAWRHGRAQSLPRLIEEQVDRTPSALALVPPTGPSLTYAALDEAANRLAHMLIDLGVGPETRVAVCLERSAALVIALYGILKAGGAYVPLDPSHPPERLVSMAVHARAPVLITRTAYAAWFGDRVPHVIDVDRTDIAAALARQNARAPAVRILPDHLCYIIFTSGSTGAPKGVMNTHRGVCNRLLWAQDRYRLRPDDRVLQKTSAGFDVSVWEFFWPLLSGATLVLAAPDRQRDGAYLAEIIQRHRITMVHFVPPMLETFLQEPEAARCTSLRHIVCSGEALMPETVAACHRTSTSVLSNLYGPTEAAVDVTAWRCPRQGAPGATVPIGRPVANTEIHVLDRHGRVVPIGAIGELFIGGIQLARGYDQRPDLTAERFVPHPCPANAGERLYRTGDLARWRADGLLEYLGRVDDQIKIRGFRIELGEIEHVLQQHPAIAQARVVACGDDPLHRTLASYVVHRPGAVTTGRAVRHWLADRVPEYMVPAAVVAISQLPLTANGKLDRRALPPPVMDDAPSAARALTPIEALLADIWAQVLRRPVVGPDADFFEEGGHSLLAAQVLARIRRLCGADIGLAAIFQHRRLRDLAATIAQARQAGAPPEPPIAVVDRTQPLPLSFAQQRIWLLDRLDPDAATYNMPIVLRLDGALVIDAVRRSLDAIVARHEVLRTQIVMYDGEPRQRAAPHVKLDVPLIDLQVLSPADRDACARRLTHEESWRPFDLSRGPLLRAHVLRLDRQTHVLAVTLHHLACDGHSMTLLTQEFAAGYQAACRGGPVDLPPLAVQYADYAVWQRAWLRGEVLARQLAYWTRQLADPPRLDLPTDRRADAAGLRRGARERFAWPDTLSDALRLFSREQGATLFMTVLAGFQILLARYTGHSDIVVGTDVANRDRLATESLVGTFVNQLALRTAVTPELTFRAVLAGVRDMTLDAYAHQDLPFEQIVEALAPARRAPGTPLFQVEVAFTAGGGDGVELPGLRIAATAFDDRVSVKNDLALTVADDGVRLSGAIAYDASLFDALTIRRLNERFERLLNGLVAEPDRPIGAISLTTPAEASADAALAAFAAD
jgi:amino acid adenylation domain-containing protein